MLLRYLAIPSAVKCTPSVCIGLCCFSRLSWVLTKCPKQLWKVHQLRIYWISSSRRWLIFGNRLDAPTLQLDFHRHCPDSIASEHTRSMKSGRWWCLQSRSPAAWIQFQHPYFSNSWTMYCRSSLPCATNHCSRDSCRCLSEMHWLLHSSRKTVLTRRMFKTIVRSQTSHLQACGKNGVPTTHRVPQCIWTPAKAAIWISITTFDRNGDAEGSVRCLSCSRSTRGDPFWAAWYVGGVRYRRPLHPPTTGRGFSLDYPELCSHGWHPSSMVVRNRWSSMARLHQWKESLPAFLKEMSLDPSFFLLYTADFPLIASEFGLGVHCYADDGQLYLSGSAESSGTSVSVVVDCIAEMDRWMSSNRLKLNTDKTQFIWLGSRQQLLKVEIDSIQLGSGSVSLKSSVNNLGVIFDSQLSMREHVRHVCRSCFYQLRQLRVVRGSLTFEASVQLVHAFINSRLDYCNSLLAGVSDQLIGQLQSVLRAAARLVLQKKKYDHISDDIRNKLHWLPIRQRISFKLCLLIFLCLRGEAPPYLTEMLSLVSSSDALRSHRSAARGDLIIPRTFTKTFGPRRVCGLWADRMELTPSIPER